MPTGEKIRRHFTEAARDAAASARRRKREHKAQFPQEHQLVMVVVRAADGPRAFAWQIRKFGHMEPVAHSVDTFPDPADAGRLGQMALDRMRMTLAAG